MTELLSQHQKDQENQLGQRLRSGFSRNGFVMGITIGLVCASALFLIKQNNIQQQLVKTQQPAENTLEETLQYIENEYVGEFDQQNLQHAALNGILQELDRHSAYLGPDAYQSLIENTDGEYAGIGVEVETKDERVFIITPIDDSPAAKMGLRAGDEIIEINGESIQSVLHSNLHNLVRGVAGSTVALTIQRTDSTQTEPAEIFEVNLVREQIPIHSVKTAHLASGVAYLRISHFTERTAIDLSKALYKWQAKTKQPTGVILDLRNNPGGLVNSAVDVADIFLESGLIVKAEGRTEEANFKHVAHVGDEVNGLPVIVLINNATASSAEIVAAALKEGDRATIIGQRSFGKGSVQSIIPMQEGGALKLTTSYYYTPSGLSLQDRGVGPDITENDSSMTIAINELHQLNTLNTELTSNQLEHTFLTTLAIKDPALLKAWRQFDKNKQRTRDHLAMDTENTIKEDK